VAVVAEQGQAVGFELHRALHAAAAIQGQAARRGQDRALRALMMRSSDIGGAPGFVRIQQQQGFHPTTAVAPDRQDARL
jgi:hypothetical protein